MIRSVERVRTRSGKVRYVVRADDGREFSTFRERIGEEAEGYQGQRVHIEYHEEERAGFHNVYLDRVQPAPGRDTADTDPEEAAWRTAVEATPWLVGSGEPEREIRPRSCSSGSSRSRIGYRTTSAATRSNAAARPLGRTLLEE